MESRSSHAAPNSNASSTIGIPAKPSDLVIDQINSLIRNIDSQKVNTPGDSGAPGGFTANPYNKYQGLASPLVASPVTGYNSAEKSMVGALSSKSLDIWLIKKHL